MSPRGKVLAADGVDGVGVADTSETEVASPDDLVPYCVDGGVARADTVSDVSGRPCRYATLFPHPMLLVAGPATFTPQR